MIKKHLFSTLVILLLVACFIFPTFFSRSANATIGVDTYQYLFQRLKSDKTIVNKLLPKGATANYSISEKNKCVTIYLSFPKGYTLRQKKELVKLIQKSIAIDKLNYIRNKEKTSGKTTSSYGTDYYLTGEKKFNSYGSTIYNFINTTGHVANYGLFEKITIAATGAGIIQNPPPNYEGIRADAKIHVWGLGLSISLPPSVSAGIITENTFSYSVSESSPDQWAVITDPRIYVCYGLSFCRFGEDQTVTIGRGGFDDPYWYYIGQNIS